MPDGDNVRRFRWAVPTLLDFVQDTRGTTMPSNRFCCAAATIVWTIFSGCSQSGLPEDLITIDSNGDLPLGDEVNDKTKRQGELSGRDVLIRANEAYASLKSYKGTISYKGHTEFTNATDRYTQQVYVFYSAPGKFRFETTAEEVYAGSCIIVRDGKETWESITLERNGRFGKSPGIRDSLLKCIAYSHGMTTRLPGILLQLKWGMGGMLPHGKYLPAFATKAKLDGKEEIEGHECYKVVCEREFANWTFWVDVDTYLLRRMDEVTSREQWAAGRNWTSRPSRILSRVHSEIYHIESVDADLDDKLFTVSKDAK